MSIRRRTDIDISWRGWIANGTKSAATGGWRLTPLCLPAGTPSAQQGATGSGALVRDNGRGIDPQVLQQGREGHWGLSGLRERAEKMGARLHVRSRAALGTEVELQAILRSSCRLHIARCDGLRDCILE